MTLLIGPIVHDQPCDGPGCGRREGPRYLVCTKAGTVRLCGICKANRDRAIQRYFDHRTAQAAMRGFWRARCHEKGMPA